MLEGGPWFILQKPPFLRKWEPGSVEKLSLLKHPLLIKLRNVPLELFTTSCIASAIGKPLYMDKTIEDWRDSFAHVCVETSCEDDLPDTISVYIERVWQVTIKG